MEARSRYQKAKRVTLIGAGINVLLSVAKVFAGIVGNSQALIADGIHSLSDLLTDGLVILGSRYASQEPDHEYPYGYHRFETAATLILCLLLILIGIGIIYDGIERIILNKVEEPKLFVIGVAAFSVVIKEWLYHYTKYVAKQIQSSLLYMNAWHHRSDAASSVVVVIGVSAAILGFSYFDSLAAIVVGAMIVKMGWSQGWSSVSELVDTGVKPQQLVQIEQLIHQVPGVIDIHQLRTRSMAGKILIDVHVLVGAKLSVSEGHYIAQQVHHHLMQEIKAITDVTVHIDPEEDLEVLIESLKLPARQMLIPNLKARWRGLPGVDCIEGFVLHYLRNAIYVEVRLPVSLLEDRTITPKKLQTVYHKALEDEQTIAGVSLSFVCY